MNKKASFECNTVRRAAVLIAVLLTLSTLSATSLMGQMFLGSVVGLITDSSGAVVPGAKVVLTNTQTLVHRETVTNNTGNYTFDDVPTGTYKVSVKQTGFTEVISSEMTVGTQATVRFDAALPVGHVSSSVEVSAAAPALNTENAEIGSVVTQSQIADLPMEKSMPNFRYLDSSNQDGGYLAGQRASFGTYTVDGVSAMAPAWGAWSGPMLGMSLDSIQDITMVSSTPSAEYGDVAHVEVSTRSGTNAFHGSAYWDTNNYALDSSDYFSHTKGHGPYRQYLGGTIGGPLTIPHLYNGKDRTFFFFEWESFLQPGGYVSQGSVPTAAFREGDFSQLLTLANPQIIYDPTTYNPATQSFSPFPKNQIPSNRINAVSAAIQGSKYIPLPNFTSTSGLFYQNNYVTSLPNAYPDYYPTLRIDHNLRSGKDAITGRWQFRHQNENGNYNGLGPEYATTQNRDTTNAYISETHSFSPHVTNQARIGFARDESAYFSNTDGSSIAQDWGLQVPTANLLNGRKGFPGINFANFNNLGGNSLSGWAQNTTEYLDNVTYTHGKHVIKTGFMGRHYLVNETVNQTNEYWGVAGFGNFGTQSILPNVPNTTPQGGFDYASFLLGIPASANIDMPGPNSVVHYDNYAAYIQDDWRATSKLTVNIGLRWDHTSAPVDQNDMRYSFNPANGDLVVPSPMALTHVSPLWPASMPIETSAQAGWSTGRSLLSLDQDFGPRLGLAYRLPHKMVVRAGGGLFYTPMESYGVINSYQGGPFAWAQGFTNVLSAPVTGSTATPTFGFPNPYSGVNNPTLASGVASGGFNISTNKNSLNSPRTQQYNLTIEKQFGNDTVATVDYQGHHTTQLVYYPDLNQPTISNNPNLLWSQLNYQQYWQVQYGVNGGSEFGNLIDLKLERRYGKGLSFSLGYTHTLIEEDVRTADWTGASDIWNWPTYSWNRNYDRGPDVGLVRDRFVGSGVWNLPFGKGQRFGSSLAKPLEDVVGGWQASFILTMRSGYLNDVNCSACNDPSNSRTWGRLDLNQLKNSSIGNPTANMWFNSQAYAPDTTEGTLGDASPGSIVGPGLVNLNFGLGKTFSIHENAKLKFQMMAMNSLNHPNLGGPNTDLSSPSVGTITYLDNTGGLGSDSSNSTMRQIMLSVHLDF